MKKILISNESTIKNCKTASLIDTSFKGAKNEVNSMKIVKNTLLCAGIN